MDSYLVLKLVHILSATIFFGTGIGSAFYMFMANCRKDVRDIFFAIRHVVIADWLFTTPAALIQPLTGVGLVYVQGYSWWDHWIFFSIILYCFSILCWIPVVIMQIKMRNMADHSVRTQEPLPILYWTLERWWITLGCFAFVAIMGIFYLMVFKSA
jgi:uncharacterized membrane protein